jgi:DNA-binding transcriptional regulator GbsR (MarR family)
MTAEPDSVKYRVPAARSGADGAADEAESIRRRFAEAWGHMGAAWGIAPSTAAVQGYLLVHGGPLTDAELQEALGLSHRAVRLALDDCAAWGIVRRAAEPRRSGRRGPAGRAWLAVDDHWEWFHRVIAGRKEREGDPVIAILEGCLVEAKQLDSGSDGDDLRRRVGSLLEFVRQFDHALSALIRTDTEVLAKLFRVMAEQDDEALDALFAKLATLPEDELADAVRALSRLPRGTVGRMLRLATRPTVIRLLGGR